MGKLLLDFHSFPLLVATTCKTPDKPQEAILKVGFSDGIYGRSKGGETPSGWKCEHLPYLVEIDNFGVSRQQPGGTHPPPRHLDLGLRRNHLGSPSRASRTATTGSAMPGIGSARPIRMATSKCPAAARSADPATASAGTTRTIPARRHRRIRPGRDDSSNLGGGCKELIVAESLGRVSDKYKMAESRINCYRASRQGLQRVFDNRGACGGDVR